MADNQNSLLTNSLTSQEKKNFYNSMKDNNFELFVSYLFGDEANEPYDIFEDLSESGNNWTIFHYAMDYGKLRIIKFIIGYLIDSNLIDIAMKMKTKDDKCPMLCLLKSNKLKLDEKKDIYFQIINSFHLTLNKDVINEANKIFYNNNIKAAILTNELTSEEKMDFYNSVIEGNLELFKNYINGASERKPYNIFEQVSAPGYNWTVFHYAMHYGKWEIIKYIFEYLIDLNIIDKALKMKTNDNRCPMLCLLKSNTLKFELKKDIYFKIINNFNVSISDEVIQEAINRNLYNSQNTQIINNKAIETDNKRDNIQKKNSILTNELTLKEKMDFYNSVIEGNLELFKNYINGTLERKPYNIFEEVSASGYNWTVFHYAMFYGKWEIIKYIFEYLSETKEIEIALNILSKDGRCPLLCLLKSNSLNKKEKREIFSKIIKNFHFTLRNEVKIELFKRKMEDLIDFTN